MTNGRKTAVLGLLVSMALMLHGVEGMLPVPYVAPGVKLGLANMVSLVAIVIFGLQEALLVVVLRTFLGALLGGVPSSFLFSGAGGILSTVVMYLVYSRTGGRFSFIGISIIGAVMHNVGQLLVASFIVENFGLYYYLPVMMVSAVITGFFIGLAAGPAIHLIGKNIRMSKEQP